MIIKIIMGKHTKFGLSTEPDPIPDGEYIKNLVVADRKNAYGWSIQKNLQLGNNVFVDRVFKFTQVPSKLQGAEWIRTACDSNLLNS